jgi:hypothetical protein
VREAALFGAASVAFEHKLECPSVLIDALFDETESIRRCATNNMAFEKFPRGSFEQLLRAMSSTDWIVRSEGANSIRHAVEEGSQRETAVSALLAALSDDRVFLVRSNAAASIWALTNNPDLVVLFYLRNVEGELDPTYETDFTQVLSGMYATKLDELAKKHPIDVAKAFQSGLASDDVRLRGNTIRQIRKLASIHEELKSECERNGIAHQLETIHNGADRNLAEDAGRTLEVLGWSTGTPSKASPAR